MAKPVILTKSRQVLDFQRKHLQGPYVAPVAVFDSERTTVCLRWEDYEDLGEPRQITVTIKPGDQLNK